MATNVNNWARTVIQMNITDGDTLKDMNVMHLSMNYKNVFE